MSNAKGRPMALACATALALAVPLSQAYVRAVAAPGPQDKWNTFTADVAIRRGLRDAARPAASTDASPVKYRLVRALSGAYWKTTMAVIGATRPDVVTPTGESLAIPPAVARIEDDGDGTEPRLYNLQGQLLRSPTKNDRQKMGAADSVFAPTDALTQSRAGGANGQRPSDQGRGWIESLMPSLDKKSARRTALEERFGNAVGKVRGLDRYLQTASDQTVEVLADEDSAVPVEINVLRGGVLLSHTTFVYEPGPQRTLVRRRASVEHAILDTPELPGLKDARLILDVELSNVTLEDRR
jgi:hypothetical protein